MVCHNCNSRCKKFGKHRNGLRRFRCKQCQKTFTEDHATPLGGMYTPLDKAAKAIELLVEGCSVSTVERFTGIHHTTILSLLDLVGSRCRRIFDTKVREIRPRYVELDELWCFVHTKEKNLHDADPTEWGDTYTWIALDAETKLVISYLVAKRDGPSALEFVSDLSRRVTGRLQLTSDGFRPYIGAVEEAFGADVDFAQLIKVYGKPDNAGPDWYGPPKVIEAVPTQVSGNPDLAHVCTSFVERGNLTVRMSLRRFTRLTNAFSKRLSYLKAAVDVYAAWYNLCRVHKTLRVTPAMQAGITDHIWTITELLEAA